LDLFGSGAGAQLLQVGAVLVDLGAGLLQLGGRRLVGERRDHVAGADLVPLGDADRLDDPVRGGAHVRVLFGENVERAADLQLQAPQEERGERGQRQGRPDGGALPGAAGVSLRRDIIRR